MKKAVVFLLAMVALLIVALMLSPVKLLNDKFKEKTAQSVNEFQDKTAQSVKAASDSVSEKLSAAGRALTPSKVPKLYELDERLLLAAKDLGELPTEVNKQKFCDVVEEAMVYTNSVRDDPLNEEEYALANKVGAKAFNFVIECLPLMAEYPR